MMQMFMMRIMNQVMGPRPSMPVMPNMTPNMMSWGGHDAKYNESGGGE